MDDCYTGTNFNRPGFQEMLDDMDLGYVTPLRKKLRTAKDIYEKSPRLYDLVKTELALEKEAREYPKTKTKENDKGGR